MLLLIPYFGGTLKYLKFPPKFWHALISKRQFSLQVNITYIYVHFCQGSPNSFISYT